MMLAGCSGDGDGETGTGSFRLLISDMPADIGDFESLDVTLSSARVFRADDDETITSAAPEGTPTGTSTSTSEETGGDDDPADGFVEFELEDVVVDLTEVVGDRALSVLDDELKEGRYSGIELRVAGAEGVVDGEPVDVMVPSDRLRIIRPFEMDADAELSFVFDINVVQRGPNGGYNLLPVIGKSGVAGDDIEVEEIDGETGRGTMNGTDMSGTDNS